MPLPLSLRHRCLVLSLAVLLSACGGNPTGSNADRPTITVLGSLTGNGADQLEEVFRDFETSSGIDVIYEGTEAFATILPLRVEAGDVPQIAIFPQPGLMKNLVRSGHMVSLDQVLQAGTLEDAFGEQWLELGSVDDRPYGLWLRANVKSLVWYSPRQFAAQGYTVPTTWAEMTALGETMVAAGQVPWCVGIEGGDASGWPATDWIEDIMLRTAGPAVYDQWVNHDIPFTDPTVQRALDYFGAIVRNPQWVLGGSVGVISTSFQDAINPLFTDPPGCYLHRQASFVQSFFPEDLDLTTDVAFFPLPPIDPAQGTPLLVGGIALGMLQDTPEARSLMAYFATVKPHEAWVNFGGYLSPHRQVSLDLYPDDLSRQQAALLQEATVIRFDGSDLMPSEVGTGTFWSGMVDYVSGSDRDRVLADIEASWPQN
ncbi:ABC transporter substrate-binding protein [Prochlorothrix hollandica]|uniref:ABC transporter substrate-binding protein n=1 Tax=Prochlorothrix hollandica TaxID=1223 RepID=UPI00036C2D45|nr:ABC transporter substrate-binding protein [Prochlorothrix hollandica]